MQPSEQVLQDLATWRCDPFVVSLYLDVDGRRSPRPSDIAPRLEHLLRLARTKAASFTHKQASAVLEAALEEIEDALARIDRRTTRGMAVFSCGKSRPLRSVALGVPVDDEVHLAAVPHLRALVEAFGRARPCLVVLADKERARLVHVEGGEAFEQPGPEDPIGHRIDTDVELGSFERRHEEARRRHLRAVAEAARHALAGDHHARVLLGGPEAKALMAELAEVAPEAGEVVVAMGASAHEVAEAAISACEDATQKEHARLFSALQERVGAGADLGISATLDALADKAVATLAVQDGLVLEGGRCSLCHALSAAREGNCGRCGGRVEPVEDLVAEAIVEALGQGADVEVVKVPGLAEAGGLGALERF
jgi:peptide subunit release factor 1 (eRF1)